MLCEWLCKKRLENLRNNLIKLNIKLEISKQRYEQMLVAYKNATDSFTEKRKKLLDKILEQEKQIQNLRAYLLILEEALEKFEGKIMPAALQDLISYYNNKYEHKEINHIGYMFSKSTQSYNMDIRNWITDTDLEINEWCESHKIPHIWDVIDEGYEYHEACDYTVNKFLSVFRPRYLWDYKEWEKYSLK